MKIVSVRAATKRFVLASATAFAALTLPQAALAQGKGYVIQWKQVGGPWKTPLYHSKTAQCLHGSPNAFCIEDFRGRYNNGQITTFWPRGCNGPPIRIQCNVQPLR